MKQQKLYQSCCCKKKLLSETHNENGGYHIIIPSLKIESFKETCIYNTSIILNEQVKSSETIITAPALSNSPQ